MGGHYAPALYRAIVCVCVCVCEGDSDIFLSRGLYTVGIIFYMFFLLLLILIKRRGAFALLLLHLLSAIPMVEGS